MKALSDEEYWSIIAEIDASLYSLESMKSELEKRDTITRMVDFSSGYEKQKSEEAMSLIKRIKELQSKLPPDDPHFKGLAL